MVWAEQIALAGEGLEELEGEGINVLGMDDAPGGPKNI